MALRTATDPGSRQIQRPDSLRSNASSKKKLVIKKKSAVNRRSARDQPKSALDDHDWDRTRSPEGARVLPLVDLTPLPDGKNLIPRIGRRARPTNQAKPHSRIAPSQAFWHEACSPREAWASSRLLLDEH